MNVRVLAILLLLVCAGSLAGNDLVVEPQNLMGARISDRAVIASILQEQLIAVPVDSVEELLILDLDGNGFSSGDLVQVLPGNQSRLLGQLSPQLQERMEKWKFASNQEVIARAGARAADVESTDDPVTAMFSALLKILETGYGQQPISMEFVRDTTTLRYRIWGYDADSLQLRKLKEFAGGRGDLIQWERVDTLFIADTVFYDVMLVIKETADTLYVPVPVYR